MKHPSQSKTPNASLEAKHVLRTLPPRWRKPSPLAFVALLIGASFFVHGLWISELTPARLWRGFFRLSDFLGQALPPNPKRLGSVIRSTLETFEMALVGTVFGAVLSLPLSILAAKNTTPHPLCFSVSRSFVTLLRVIPDLIWGLIFIIVVGLGPAAGIMAITVDVMGFCGKFFAERIEEIDPGPMEALRAIGASEASIIAGAIFPATLPSFVASTLFSLESSVRSAVVLGLVGAGGIGATLNTAFDRYEYDTAAAILILIIGIVMALEYISGIVRARVQ